MKSKQKIRFYTRHPKNLLKQMIESSIPLDQIIIEKNYLEVIIGEEYHNLIKNKTIKRIEIIKYYGIKRVIKLLERYKYWIIFFIIQLMILIIVSHLILKIEVKTTNTNLKKIVLDSLKEEGIKEYSWKVSFQKKEKIKKKILNKNSNTIEWIEINEIGTKYIIHVEPKKIKEYENTCKPRHIISKKDSIITRIESSSGEIIKKKDDYVEKGEILISGLVNNKETIVAKRCAEGTVYGEVWYKVKVVIPKTIEIKEKTGKEKLGLLIKYKEKEINIFKKYKNNEKSEYNIINSKIIPLQIGIIKYKELRITKRNYTEKEIETLAYQTAIKKITQTTSNNSVVLSKKVLKKYTNNSKIIIEVFLSMEEDITAYQDIEEKSIEELNQEKEG